jgi:glycosyltransferase involved in cell wall biosynthesis
MRLAIVTSHPIQYHAPWFRALGEQPGIDLEVLYCHRATQKDQADAGFGVEFEWDRSLLDGYTYNFLTNVSATPNVSHFSGLDTPELAERLKHYSAVLVSGWHYKSALQAIWTCWRRRIPVMVRSDSHLHTPRSVLKKFMKELPYRGFITRLDACLAVGQWSKEYFLHYGASRDRIFLVPHGVDEFFDRSPETSTERCVALRSQWGLESNRIVFLFVGKFIAVKRPLDFVRAIKLAHRRNHRITGLMVGDGPLRERCERLVAEFDLPIRFSGFLNQSRIMEAYAVADALILPSEGETWGLVVNEAMSCRRPTVVSDQVGCAPDLVLEGKTGFVFPAGDVEALASRIINCAAAPEQLAIMGVHAKAHMESYSIPAAVRGVTEALGRIVRC